MNEEIELAQMEMEEAVSAFRHELARVRTGRASTALLEDLHVNYYGTKTPLRQLAGLAAPEARLLVITPYDKGAMGEIEKAIQTSDLGLNPMNDGKVIRIPIPELNEERRKESGAPHSQDCRGISRLDPQPSARRQRQVQADAQGQESWPTTTCGPPRRKDPAAHHRITSKSSTKFWPPRKPR